MLVRKRAPLALFFFALSFDDCYFVTQKTSVDSNNSAATSGIRGWEDSNESSELG